MAHTFPRTLGLLGLLALLCACADSHVSIQGCEPEGDIRVYCVIRTPEDIAALPGGRHLLLAHFGHMGKDTGSISLFDTSSETKALQAHSTGEGVSSLSPIRSSMMW